MRNRYICDIQRSRLKRDTAITLLVLAGLALAGYHVASTEEVIPVTKTVGCRECHKPTAHQKLSEYLKEKGSPVPTKMATAILKQPKPMRPLLAKIAVQETNANPKLRKFGYRNAHSGAWAVNEKLHGKVSTNPDKQCEQASKYLAELMKMTDGNLQQALSIYGGDTSKRRWYASSILRDLEEAGE